MWELAANSGSSWMSQAPNLHFVRQLLTDHKLLRNFAVSFVGLVTAMKEGQVLFSVTKAWVSVSAKQMQKATNVRDARMGHTIVIHTILMVVPLVSATAGQAAALLPKVL